jgi:hypothetical protein
LIVVIQCAASKRSTAGHLQTTDGQPVLFVANPLIAPDQKGLTYRRPDDRTEGGETGRELLLRYNQSPGENALGLLPAYQLYSNDVYHRLVNWFGIEKTFILSAGWGLINASLLTPAYDITFSASADEYKRRRKNDGYNDFKMIPAACEEEVVFLGGKDYLPLFCSLTGALTCRRTAFYNSSSAPNAPGCHLTRFATKTRTNWHYECARELLNNGAARS